VRISANPLRLRAGYRRLTRRPRLGLGLVAAAAVLAGGAATLMAAPSVHPTAPTRAVQTSAPGGAYTALTPVRLLDTRATSPKSTLAPGGSVSLVVTGFNAVPTNATAVALNVTATDTTAASFLSVYPTGGTLPVVSNLNWSNGETVANSVIVPVGTGSNAGSITLYNQLGHTDVVVDLEGYFAPETGAATAGAYVPLTPSRIDTGTTVGAGATVPLQVTGSGGVPAGATGAILNVTVTDTTAASYLTVFPAGATRPLASNLNWLTGGTVANRVLASLPTSGTISIYNALGSADVIVDVSGYFTNGTSALPSNATIYNPVAPLRITDTRAGSGYANQGHTLSGGESLPVQVTGEATIPADATAAVLNVTATDATHASYFTVYPTGDPLPATSDVNWLAGQTVPNLTVATLGTGGQIEVFNDLGNADLVVDAFGYFSPFYLAQTITFTSTAPTGAQVNGTYTPTATASSALTVAITIDSTSSAVCSITGGVVTFHTTGTCTIDANQAGNSTYSAAPQVQQVIAVGLNPQTITFTSTAPTSAAVNGTYTPTATASSGLTVAITIDSTSSAVCSITGGVVTFNATGNCTVDANQAGNFAYSPAPQVQQVIPVGLAPQTITFTSTAPTNAEVGENYTPTATASSGLTVAFTIDSTSSAVCSINVSEVVTFNAAGTCTIDANQAGNSTYGAAPQVHQAVTVTVVPQTITITSAAPTNAVVGGATYTPTGTASSGLTVAFTIDSTSSAVCSISGGAVSFTAVGTCTIDANQSGNATYGPAPQVQQPVTVAKGSQTITFTTTTPTNATVGGVTYTPAATASSGLTVAITIDAGSSSICSITGGAVSFTAVGTCTIDANQAGNTNYDAALQAQQAVTVAKGAQTITFTSTAPTGAQVGGNYTPTATSSSGLTVTIAIDAGSSSVCSINGSGVVTFNAAGTCTIDANQAGSVNYNAASQVQQAVAVGLVSQTITFTSTAPTSAVVGGATYTPTASASSGLSVTITIDATSSGVCSISGGAVSFTAAGTCTIDGNQSGNSTYGPAPQRQQAFTVGKGSQTITFTSTAPTGAEVGGNYTPTAISSSGLTVTIAIDATSSSVCSISGGVVTFNAAGTCKVDANQAGSVNYNAAAQVQQSITVSLVPQTVNFTSTAPTGAQVGGTYTPTGTASSGLTVAFTIDASTHTVCSITSGTVHFLTAGTCEVDANQAGNGTYSAAPQVQQSFVISLDPQTITFTSTAPTNAVVGGATYTPTATATSGLGVTITIAGSSSGVCSISSGAVSFQGAGTCTIDANQAGNATYAAAPQVQQTFTVGQGSQTISFTSTPPNNAGIGGTYTATATATSGAPVTLTIDSTSSAICSISGGLVTFNAAGTCTIDANQSGTANYNAAPQVQQLVTVWGAPLSIGTGYLACGGCSSTVIGSGDTLTVTFNGTVELAGTWSLTVADGTGNVNVINNSDATGTVSNTGGGTHNVVSYTLSSIPTISHGTFANFSGLEVLSQTGVTNSSSQPWNLPGSGRETGGTATTGISRIFDGSNSSLGAAPTATAANVNTITVTACTAGDSVNVYNSDGVLLGTATCGVGGTVTFGTTTDFTSGQALLITQESATGYESLASQVIAS